MKIYVIQIIIQKVRMGLNVDYVVILILLVININYLIQKDVWVLYPPIQLHIIQNYIYIHVKQIID